MNRGGQSAEYQLQSIGIAVAANLTLTQLELMQHCLDMLLRNAVLGDVLQNIDNQMLECLCVFGLAALDTAHETHFIVRIFQSTKRGRCRTQVGRFQRLAQR